jgi:hypothetical protein
MGGGHLPVHVELRAAPHDPLGQLVAATAAQHHAGAVEADPVEEAAHPGVLAHQRLVVGGEGLGAAHRALDTDLEVGSLGYNRGEIIPVRGQSYVLRLPKY